MKSPRLPRQTPRREQQPCGFFYAPTEPRSVWWPLCCGDFLRGSKSGSPSSSRRAKDGCYGSFQLLGGNFWRHDSDNQIFALRPCHSVGQLGVHLATITRHFDYCYADQRPPLNRLLRFPRLTAARLAAIGCAGDEPIYGSVNRPQPPRQRCRLAALLLTRPPWVRR